MDKIAKAMPSPLKLILALCSILLVLIPVVMAYGALTETVDNLEKDIVNFEERIILLEKIAAGTEVSLINIEKDVSLIKQYILNSENKK